jgi:hypothetical protein
MVDMAESYVKRQRAASQLCAAMMIVDDCAGGFRIISVSNGLQAPAT